jgi:hypothetical protein
VLKQQITSAHKEYLMMQSERTLTINWAGLISFAIFFLWAINAYPAGSKLNDLPVNISIVLLFCYFISQYHAPNFRTIVSFNIRSLAIFVVLALIAVFLSWRHLEQPLWGDQIYHANYAARQGQLAIFLVEQKFPSLWSEIKDISASTVVWGVNLVLICIFGLLFILLPKLLATQKKLFVFFMLLALIASKAALSGNGNMFSGVSGSAFLPTDYGSDPHPIFRLFPLMLSSAIWGVSDFGYRMAAFTGYLVFLLFVFVKINGQAGRHLAFSAIVALGTLPILWHVSYLAEQSVWSTLASSAVFVMLFSAKDLESIPLIPIIALVILATLSRSPAFVAFAPVAIVIGYRMLKGNIKRVDRAPVLILIATLALFVLISVLRGSPATDTEVPLAKWLFAESNNIPGIAAVSVLGLAPFFFIGYVFRMATREHLILVGATIIFFALGGLVYYAPVSRNLWGVGRYQAEMYVPLITAGIVAYCMTYAKERNAKWLAAIPLIILALVNVFSILTFDARTFRPFADNPTPGEAVKSEVEYPAREAFQFVREHNLQDHAYYVGIYYGGFVSALRGYSAGEYFNFFQLNNRHRNGWAVNLDAINADTEIGSVVIEPEADFGAIQGLLERGWKGRHDFTHAKSGHKMIVLTRENI